MSKDLFSKLKEYSQTDYYPFHMPGHKRSLPSPYNYDITEIEGFDNLHNPQGIICDIMKKASDFYGAMETYILVNGSTCGVLSGIMAATNKREKILVARNCHKSVYNAVLLNELTPEYVYPEIIENMGISGEICPSAVDNLIKENPDIKAVVITSPTYEGVVSDIKSISEILHKKNIPLIVDEAHGAHLGRHKEFLPSALDEGADIVVQSLHKTLPSLTQTAILHFNSKLISKEKLEEYLSIFQSSSPSYILMASIDKCINLLIENKEELFDEYLKMLKEFRKKAETFKKIKLFEAGDVDISKLVISVRNTNYDGEKLYKELLDKYHIQVEMISDNYVIAMTSLCDTKEGFERIYKALFEIDNKICFVKEQKEIIKYSKITKKYCNPSEAFQKEKEAIKIEKSLGKVSGEYKFIYPPGIPVIVPGEIIDEEIINIFRKHNEKIKVLKGEN